MVNINESELTALLANATKISKEAALVGSADAVDLLAKSIEEVASEAQTPEARQLLSQIAEETRKLAILMREQAVAPVQD